MITPARRKSLYEDISNQIIDLIANGIWTESEKIPGEVELAGMFEVSRNSVRESIKALELIGILRAKSGNGTFVAEGARARIGRFKAQSLPEDEQSLTEIMEARLIIEPGLVKLATQKADPGHLDALETILKRCREAFSANDYDFELGFSFHYNLFLMSGNKILIGMIEQLKSTLVAVRSKIFFKHADLKVLMHELDQHREILALMRAGDAERAASAMETHIAESLTQLRKAKK